jgi:hypothetical protein
MAFCQISSESSEEMNGRTTTILGHGTAVIVQRRADLRMTKPVRVPPCTEMFALFVPSAQWQIFYCLPASIVSESKSTLALAKRAKKAPD